MTPVTDGNLEGEGKMGRDIIVEGETVALEGEGKIKEEEREEREEEEEKKKRERKWEDSEERPAGWLLHYMTIPYGIPAGDHYRI